MSGKNSVSNKQTNALNRQLYRASLQFCCYLYRLFGWLSHCAVPFSFVSCNCWPFAFVILLKRTNTHGVYYTRYACMHTQQIFTQHLLTHCQGENCLLLTLHTRSHSLSVSMQCIRTRFAHKLKLLTMQHYFDRGLLHTFTTGENSENLLTSN